MEDINFTMKIENNLPVTGATEYKGLTAQQHRDAFAVFKQFLSVIRPERILEIGTAGGGLTLFLRDSLDELGLYDTKIVTYDVKDNKNYDILRNKNIVVNIENIFDYSYNNIENKSFVEPFIQSDGTTLVLCDGGHKIGEFNIFSKMIKTGDFIMAHDYVDTWENYKNNYVDKIWNWCEIEEKYIEKCSIENNLYHVNKEVFDKIVWVCKIKR